MKTNNVQQELNRALSEIGITDLFSTDKFANKIKQHKKKTGRLDELKEHVNRVMKQPKYQLMKEVPINKWNGNEGNLSFYEILESEGITLEPDNPSHPQTGYFLRLNGERVGYVNEQIIPLKGEKERLREVLKKIVDLTHELDYPSEVYELPSYIDKKNGWFNSKRRKWVYPKDFIQANKSTYLFGQFWRNINKPVKKSENPFIQALTHLDELLEYNPYEELKQIQRRKGFRQSQVELRLLEELEGTRVCKGRRWGIIPTTELKMNPRYEEFFYNHLGDYSTEEIDNALKGLEGELTGGNKAKIKILRKEFEKKEGISRRKKLAVLLGSLLGGAAACYAVRQLTRDRNTPQIKNLKWEPTKTVNNKVYDGRVSFVVEDEEPVINIFGLKFPLYKAQILNSTLEFIPKTYSHLPKKAFPNETVRKFNLIPVDGKFDEKTEEFAVNITGIRGGREYAIKVIAQDRAGNIKSASLITPYIREFENIAPLDNVLVGATYYPLYPDPHSWEGLKSPYAPLLGYYNVTDPIVVSKHIDWATGHGIDIFFFSWGMFPEDNLTLRVHKNILKILENPLSKDIRAAILYEFPHRARRANLTFDEHGFIYYDKNKWQVILDDFRLMSKDIFTSSNYLRINGSPVVYMYESKALSKNNLTTVEQAINRIREAVKKTINTGLYLIGDLPYAPFGLYFDGWTNWAGTYVRDRLYSLEGTNSTYEKFREEAIKYGRDFYPSALPGFIDPINPPLFPLARNVTRFKEAFRIALNTTFSEYNPMVRIDTYNEWWESTGIEPTVEEGFSYLQAVLNTLRESEK